jgi:hypothetical protein
MASVVRSSGSNVRRRVFGGRAVGIERRQLPQSAINGEASGNPTEIDDKRECHGIRDAQSKSSQRVRACRKFCEWHPHDQDQTRDPHQHSRKPNNRQHDKRQHVRDGLGDRLLVFPSGIAPEEKDGTFR